METVITFVPAIIALNLLLQSSSDDTIPHQVIIEAVPDLGQSQNICAISATWYARTS